ncbi:hypothetical protein Pfo_004945 [Paulownia fortunei]|nr:hypothetical protein Pfo_004945 [Paulownia fortunei]
MENQRDSKASDLKSLEGIISPINEPNLVGDRRNRHSLAKLEEDAVPKSNQGGSESSLTFQASERCRVVLVYHSGSAEIFKSNNSLQGSGSSDGTENLPLNQLTLPSVPRPMALPTSSLQAEQTSVSTISSSNTPNTTLPHLDWTPQDDGIDVTLPCVSTEKKNPSREDVEAFMRNILYGPGSGRRLPAFNDIPLEPSDPDD